MLALRMLAGAGSAALGWLGADQVSSNGPDLAGIALLITAISGLIATIGGLIIGLRRKPTNPTDALIIALATQLADKAEADHDEPA